MVQLISKVSTNVASRAIRFLAEEQIAAAFCFFAHRVTIGNSLQSGKLLVQVWILGLQFIQVRKFFRERFQQTSHGLVQIVGTWASDNGALEGCDGLARQSNVRFLTKDLFKLDPVSFVGTDQLHNSLVGVPHLNRVCHRADCLRFQAVSPTVPELSLAEDSIE